MGERGPAPKPTRIKELEGNPGKRALPKNEPRPELGAPDMPEWLPEDAKAEWRRVAPELSRLGLLAKIDGSALAAYCEAFSRWKQAVEMMAEDGIVFVTAAGYTAQHPAVGIANKAKVDMLRFGREFGLTPSARGRMNLPGEKPEADPMETLLSGPPKLEVV